MSAPAAITWAATGAITTPSADKQALGFVPNERPPAQTLNWVLNLLALWVTYLAAHAGVGWRWFTPRGDLVNVTRSGSGYIGSYVTIASTNGAIGGIQLNVTVGQTIDQFGCNCMTSSILSPLTMALYRVEIATGIATALPTASGTTTPFSDTVNGVFQKHTAALTTPEVVQDGCAYYFDLAMNAGNAGPIVVTAVGFDVAG